MRPLTPKFPKLLHGGDYNPEQWLRYPEILKQDVELMKKADINCVSVGIFSWAHLEPNEGEYDFDWLEKIIDNLYKNGIYTVLATPSGAKPLWMSEKYEEIRRVQNNGVRDLSGARHNHCYTSLQTTRASFCGTFLMSTAASATARCANRRSAIG